MTTTTHSISLPDPEQSENIEGLLRARGLRLLYRSFSNEQPVDDGPSAGLILDFNVVYSNGRRPFFSSVVIDSTTAYGLLSDAHISASEAEAALDEIIDAAREIDWPEVENFERDDSYAAAISDWTHSDGDLLRCASAQVEGDLGLLLYHLGTLVDEMPLGSSLALPQVQVAALAVRIAWDLL